MNSHATDLESHFAPVFQQDVLLSLHARQAFEVLETLGEGGMGTVYKIRDKRLGRLAALKLLHDQSPEAQARFLREAHITAALDHPNIPPLFEAGRSPSGELYLLMRLINGQTLTQHLNNLDFQPGKPPQQLLSALLKIARALSYAHSRGFIHRDVKPDNIMIGAFGEVLLMDWGIARDQRDSASEELALAASQFAWQVPQAPDLPEGLTQAGAILGTPGYAAPEQLEGLELDPRADVFALGLILFEVLTSQRAIIGRTALDRARATLSSTLPTARSLHPKIPAELSWISEQAIKQDPDERTHSAEDFAEQLEAWLRGEPVPGYPYSSSANLLRALQGRPLLVLSITLCSILIALASALQESRRESRRRANTLAAALAKEEQSRAQLENERIINGQIEEALELARRGAPRDRIQEILHRALQKSGADYARLLRAAEIYELAGLNTERRAALEKAVESDPAAIEALYQLYTIEAAGSHEPLTLTPALTTLIQRSKDRGFENEFTLFAEALRAHSRGDIDEALRLYNRAEKLSTRLAWLYNNRAIARIAQKDLDGALADCDRAIELDSRSPSIYCNRASIKKNHQKNIDGALDDYNNALKLDPNKTAALNNRALILSSLGDFDGALEDYTRAIEVDPAYQSAYKNRGNLYGALRRPQEALRDYNQAIEIDPRDSTAYFGRAQLRRKMNDVKGALSDYDQAIQLDSSRSLYFKGRGTLYLLQRELDRAKADFDEALRRDPKLEDALLNRANIRSMQGDKAGAVEDFTRALELAPNNPTTYFGRGQARKLLGDLDGARQDYQRFLELAPTNSLAPRVRDELKKLEQ